MVDVASIVIAVVSLVGSLAAAGFTGWISYYIDQHKRQLEAKALTNKYRDPLTLSAYDLQSRFFGIIERNLLVYIDDPSKKALVKTYTAFLIGQYFSWVYIFRRQAQFLRFSTDKKNVQLNRIMDAITQEFSDDRPGEATFMLWRGQQMAIGEVMTLNEDGQLYCMGYAEFSKKYAHDEEFRHWFESIEHDVGELSRALREGNHHAANKMRRLQHWLIDLVFLLDASLISSHGFQKSKVKGAQRCSCRDCFGGKVVDISNMTKQEMA